MSEWSLSKGSVLACDLKVSVLCYLDLRRVPEQLLYRLKLLQILLVDRPVATALAVAVTFTLTLTFTRRLPAIDLLIYQTRHYLKVSPFLYAEVYI